MAELTNAKLATYAPMDVPGEILGVIAQHEITRVCDRYNPRPYTLVSTISRKQCLGGCVHTYLSTVHVTTEGTAYRMAGSCYISQDRAAELLAGWGI